MSDDSKPQSDVDLVVNNWTDKKRVLEIFRGWEPARIVEVLPHLASTGESGEKMKALRDAGRAVIDSKLTSEIVTTMERLDKTATRLSVVGIILSVVIGVAGILVTFFAR